MEDAIADIATVFHWQPNAFDDMDLNELMQWHEKAHQRAEAQNQN
ncbi:GpE family phage tail protein [Basfia succiniciproducens]